MTVNNKDDILNHLFKDKSHEFSSPEYEYEAAESNSSSDGISMPSMCPRTSLLLEYKSETLKAVYKSFKIDKIAPKNYA